MLTFSSNSVKNADMATIARKRLQSDNIKHRYRRTSMLQRIAALAFWLMIWQLIAVIIGQRFLLAAPMQVLQALVRLAPTATFWQTLAATALRIVGGFLIGITAGALLAYAAHLSTWLTALVQVPMRVMRSVPVVSFVILVLLFAGSTGLTITIAALIVAPIAFANVQNGLMQQDPDLTDVAKVFNANKWQSFQAVTWPAVLPFLAAAAQSGFGLAWKAGISAEVIGIPRGSIGERFYQARLTLATDDVLAWTVIIIVMAWLGERLLNHLLASPE